MTPPPDEVYRERMTTTTTQPHGPPAKNRQTAYHRRMLAKGFARVAVYVPRGRMAELRRIAAGWQREFEFPPRKEF